MFCCDREREVGSGGEAIKNGQFSHNNVGYIIIKTRLKLSLKLKLKQNQSQIHKLPLSCHLQLQWAMSSMPRSPIHRSTPLQPGGATPELESKPLNYKLIAGADLQLLRLTHAHSHLHLYACECEYKYECDCECVWYVIGFDKQVTRQPNEPG